MAAAFASIDGAPLQFLFLHLSGVIQGCPLSALIFILCMDPFLKEIDRLLAPVAGLARACADDIGICAKELSHLIPLAPVLLAAETVANLKLHPTKSLLIPFGGGKL